MKELIIGDIHGCLEELKEMVSLVPKDTKIVLVGDLIDRGPNSKEVVEYCINNNIEVCLGNHELMCIETEEEIISYIYNSEDPYTKYILRYTDWFYNGVDSVYKQYTDKKLLLKHIKYFKILPI